MSEEAVVEAIADSSPVESEGIDIESTSNELAADLFPESEREPTEQEPEQRAEPEVEPETVVEPEPEIVSTAPKSWPKEMHDHWAKMPKETDTMKTKEKCATKNRADGLCTKELPKRRKSHLNGMDGYTLQRKFPLNLILLILGKKNIFPT